MKIYLKDVEQVSKIVDSNGADITATEMQKIREGKHFIKQDEYELGKRDMQKYINENDNHSLTNGKNKKQPRRDAPLPKFKL